MDQRVLKAFRHEDVHQILRLVRRNPELFRGRTPRGNTALHLAARLKDKRVADKILRLEVSFLYEKNQNDETPMHIAAKAGNASVIKVMLERDNNMNVINQERILCMKDNQGNIPLHNAVKNHHDLSSVLLMKMCETMWFENDAKQSPLSIAFDSGSTYITWFIMKENPSFLNYKGPNDLTVLHYAVINQNYVSVVEIVHRKGELIKKVDGHKRNPLHYAAALGNVAIARGLLEADASSSVAYDRDCKGLTPLHLAAKYGQPDILRLILADYRDSIELVNEKQRNILHLAALKGKDDTVRFILSLPEMEDLINSPDVHGNTPMHLAALKSHSNVFDILSRNNKVNKRATNSNQQTALAIAPSSWDAKLDIKKAEKRNIAQVVLLMATIIVTFTFTAALTLPGGYKDKDNDPRDGTAKLVGKPGFKTFVISIAIAMTSAMTAAVLALAQIRHENHRRLRGVDLMLPATILVYIGLLSMAVAFMTGLYVVLYTNLALAIAVISVSCVFPYIMILLVTALEVGVYRFEEFLHDFLIRSFPLESVLEQGQCFRLASLFREMLSTVGLVVPDWIMLDQVISNWINLERVIPDWIITDWVGVVLGQANKLPYLLESTYIRWYDRQIESTLNSSLFMVHVDLVVALLGMLRYAVRFLWLKSNRGHHTAALEFTSTI